MNRLQRDQLLHRALDMIDAPSLDAKDRPGGVIGADAISATWLQEGIDYFHRTFPWSGTIATTSQTYSAATATLPTDYTLDLHNGFRITSPTQYKRRLARKSFQYYLSCDPATTGTPKIYVIHGTTVRFWPTPEQTYTGDLWYYQLPAVMTATSTPVFPDDFVLLEFVRLRGTEWAGAAEPGTALGYARTIAAALVKQGLGIEPESQVFDFDRTIYRGQGAEPSDPTGWMGLTVVQ